MKVLAVMGSPRKRGNTYRVVERIKESLLAYDKGIDFEFLFLQDYNLAMCAGCFTCFARGEEHCPLKDDRVVIASKMSGADGIIFAAPTYAMGVPALMKSFIDRFAYTCHRPQFFDKAFMAVATVGGVIGTKQALQQLALLSGGGRLVKKLGISTPPIPMTGYAQKAKRKIQKASKAFYAALKKPARKLPGAAEWAWFHSFKSMCAFAAYREVCPADHAYYKDRGAYFYPLNGHRVRRLLGKALGGLMRFGFGFLMKKEMD
ncbi:MAG: NAD(P)H-dependent oxidoreductase [Christensenellales bacterium]|jgi:multimeric flavodoxin WrbA